MTEVTDFAKYKQQQDDPFGSPPGVVPKKTGYRMLRSYRRVAQQEHFCDHCFLLIFPGEWYEGRVEVNGKGRLWVYREHVEPRCEWPTDPDDDGEYKGDFEADSLSAAA